VVIAHSPWGSKTRQERSSIKWNVNRSQILDATFTSFSARGFLDYMVCETLFSTGENGKVRPRTVAVLASTLAQQMKNA
jgi:hypothetical protein